MVMVVTIAFVYSIQLNSRLIILLFTTDGGNAFFKQIIRMIVGMEILIISALNQARITIF
jgi:hypothetical protein